MERTGAGWGSGLLGVIIFSGSLPATRVAIHGRLGPFLNSFSGVGWTLLAVMWFGVESTTVIFSISAVLLPFALRIPRAA
mgnify:CR=1 FL=1